MSRQNRKGYGLTYVCLSEDLLDGTGLSRVDLNLCVHGTCAMLVSRCTIIVCVYVCVCVCVGGSLLQHDRPADDTQSASHDVGVCSGF